MVSRFSLGKAGSAGFRARNGLSTLTVVGRFGVVTQVARDLPTGSIATMVRLRAGAGHAGRGGLPHQINLRRGQGVGLVDKVAEGALQFQGFRGGGAGGVDGAGVFVPATRGVRRWSAAATWLA